MALAGTLKDFSLADIFQLIALQKKTGYLTLKSETEVVTVTFHEGSVVGADSLHKRLEDRLGHVLVKSGRISKEELTKALEIQKQTLQRLGYIVVSEGFIDATSLKAALAVQMQQTIYRLFRWKDGEYNFEPHDAVEYDRENVTPMAAESILMEGIRMLDEWPLIEKKIASFELVLEKVALPTAPVLDTRTEVPSLDDLFSFGPDTAAKKPAAKAPAHDEAVVRLSQEEMAVYQHVNGVFTVQEIIDRCGLNEFETCKALFELMNRHLIQPVATGLSEMEEEEAKPISAQAVLDRVLMPAFWVFLVASVLLLPFHPFGHFPGSASDFARDQKIIQSRMALQRAVSAVYAFRLQEGRLPKTLDEVTNRGLLPLSGMMDAFGEPLVYQLTEGGYMMTLRSPRAWSFKELPPEEISVTSDQSAQ